MMLLFLPIADAFIKLRRSFPGFTSLKEPVIFSSLFHWLVLVFGYCLMVFSLFYVSCELTGFPGILAIITGWSTLRVPKLGSCSNNDGNTEEDVTQTFRQF